MYEILFYFSISVGESNTVVSAYTMYRHLQQYCSPPIDILCTSLRALFVLSCNTEIPLLLIAERNQFGGEVSGLPVNHGFVPFRYPENQSGPALHFNAFRQGANPNRKLPFSPGLPPLRRFPEFDMHPPMRNFYNFSPQMFPTNFKKSGKGYYY